MCEPCLHYVQYMMYFAAPSRLQTYFSAEHMGQFYRFASTCWGFRDTRCYRPSRLSFYMVFISNLVYVEEGAGMGAGNPSPSMPLFPSLSTPINTHTPLKHHSHTT